MIIAPEQMMYSGSSVVSCDVCVCDDVEDVFLRDNIDADVLEYDVDDVFV